MYNSIFRICIVVAVGCNILLLPRMLRADCGLEQARIGCPNGTYVGSTVSIKDRTVGPGCWGWLEYRFVDEGGGICTSRCPDCPASLTSQQSTEMTSTLNVIYGKIRSAIFGSPEHYGNTNVHSVAPGGIRGSDRKSTDLSTRIGLAGFDLPRTELGPVTIVIPKFVAGQEQTFDNVLVSFVLNNSDQVKNVGKYLWINDINEELLFYYSLTDIVDGNVLTAKFDKQLLVDNGDSYSMTFVPYLSNSAVGTVFFSPWCAQPSVLGTISGLTFASFNSDNYVPWTLSGDSLVAAADKTSHLKATISGYASLGFEFMTPTDGVLHVYVDDDSVFRQAFSGSLLSVYNMIDGLILPSGEHLVSWDFTPTKYTSQQIVIRNIVATPLPIVVPKIPLYNIPDTGLVKCYNSTEEISCPQKGQDYYGQDANYQYATSTYTDLSVDVVQDDLTNLKWMRTISTDAVYSWDYAAIACDAMNVDANTKWRLPSLRESSSLIKFASGSYIDQNHFSLGSGLSYIYLSEVYPYYQFPSSWVINIHTGQYAITSKYSSYPRFCVDGAALPEGQFVKYKESTLMDVSTGLMWEKMPSTSVVHWKDALTYCEAKNTDGFTDWRLPDKHQLESIISTKGIEPTLDSQFVINNSAYENYWTSTTDFSLPSYAFVVNFNYGYTTKYSKSDSTHFVRCVRDGLKSSMHTLPLSLLLRDNK